jgi:DNA-binding response OmpR family regulator
LLLDESSLGRQSMAPKTTILAADDDRILTVTLGLYLSRAGYEVRIASSGADALRQIYQVAPDLVLLDVGMPGMDGWETLARIREVSDLPIIVVTARAQEADRIRGLKLGADDYVCKPFSLQEVLARIETVLRRATRRETAAGRHAYYVTEDLVIDSGLWEVRHNGRRVDLTELELRLILLLAENAGRVLTNRQILERIWGDEHREYVHYPRIYVWRLRRKIERDPHHPKYILTERGIGYRMALPG